MSDTPTERTWPEIVVGTDLSSSLHSKWLLGNKRSVLTLCAAITLGVAALDFWAEPYLSLGFLYVFPIILASAYVPRWIILLLACFYAGLSEACNYTALPIQFLPIRMVFEAVGYAGSGLIAGELIRGRRRQDAMLRALVETSTAAIITVNERGSIELANQGALELFAPEDELLVGRPIAEFLPSLHKVLWRGERARFRAALECVGHKGNGEIFNAHVWFSTYHDGNTARLAAIIGNVGPVELSKPAVEEVETIPEFAEGHTGVELSSREAAVMQMLVQGLSNKEIATQVQTSESTVKHTIQQLFAKTGVRTRGQLVRVALERFRELL